MLGYVQILVERVSCVQENNVNGQSFLQFSPRIGFDIANRDSYMCMKHYSPLLGMS